MPLKPFTDEDKKKLDKALSDIGEAEKQIVLAKAAGIDVTEADKKTKELKTKLTAIKNVYFAKR